jgi:hypothetical protein
MSFLAYYHTALRWALTNLSASEFEVYTYLISIALRPRKSEVKGYTNGKEVYNLYRKGRLLSVNVSLGRIARECGLGIRTVSSAIKTFGERGIIIKITHKRGRTNNVYLVGIENMWADIDSYKPDWYFTEFTFIEEGKEMPPPVRDFILSNRYSSEDLHHGKIPGLNKTLNELFVRVKGQRTNTVIDLWEAKRSQLFSTMHGLQG